MSMKYYKYLFLMLCALEVGVVKDLRADELCVKDKVCYEVEVAKTAKEKAKGLMFVKEMDKNKGMMFDFSKQDTRYVAMWMKNTYISLDMIFIDCDGGIVDVKENTTPLSLESIRSFKKYCYILEVNGGEFMARGLRIGDKFEMN